MKLIHPVQVNQPLEGIDDMNDIYCKKKGLIWVHSRCQIQRGYVICNLNVWLTNITTFNLKKVEGGFNQPSATLNARY